DEQPALLVAHRGGRARCVVDQRHLPEVVRRAQYRERFLAHAGHDATDAHRALDDQIELVAGLALRKDRRADSILFLDADVDDTAQVALRQPAEQIDLREDLERRLAFDVELARSWRLAHMRT